MRARTGKIARLPSQVRHELNQRLHNGALAKDLVPWLNSLPEVQHVLANRFGARPISQDNISEWRHGGFQDWLRDQERRLRLDELSAQNDPEEENPPLDAQLQHRLLMELAEEVERLSTLKNGADRWRRLQRISQELCRLQRTRNRNLEVRLFETKSRLVPSQSHPSRPESDLVGAFRTKDPIGGPQKTPYNKSINDNRETDVFKI